MKKELSKFLKNHKKNIIQNLKLTGYFSALFFFFFTYNFFVPYNISEKLIHIKQGETLNSAIKKLEQNKIIKTPSLFKTYAFITFNGNNIKAGEYMFKNKTSNYLVLKKITSGKTHQRFITIPEGLTVKQIKNLLNKNQNITGKANLEIEEGSLLPNTYAYTSKTTKNNILKKMQENMERTINALWDKRDTDIPIKTKKEALILASIVEKETGIAEERPIIASVFENRLKINMPLQTDPTVVYALTNKLGDMQEKRLLSRHLKINSPYNTYRNYGLPPTPIANPGIEALKAVLNPAETEYLYFVADGKGGHFFAKTLREHENNRRKWRKLRRSYDLNKIRNKKKQPN